MAEPNLAAVRPARRYEGLSLIGLAGVVSVGLAIALWAGDRSDNLTPAAVAAHLCTSHESDLLRRHSPPIARRTMLPPPTSSIGASFFCL